MSRLVRLVLGSLPLFFACAPPPPPPLSASAGPVSSAAPVAEPAKTITTDSTAPTVGSSRVVVPAGWAYGALPDGLITTAPDGDLRVASFVSKETEADAAVAKAWAAFSPAKTRKGGQVARWSASR